MMLLAYFVGDVGWKRIEADVIAGPTWPSEFNCILPLLAALVSRNNKPVMLITDTIAVREYTIRSEVPLN